MKELKLVLLLVILAALAAADQWYTTDSNLISAAQFTSKIAQDKLSYKFVKYFTPHCPYCRHLKTVFDHLKQKKDWCFKIYDINCQQDPQFCSRNMKSTSFPYTAIYDQNGKLVEEIQGFYPQTIISATFDRIEGRCQAVRAPPAAKKYQPESVIPFPQSAQQQRSNINSQQKPVKPSLPQQQPKVQSQSKLPLQEKTQAHLGSSSLRMGQIEAQHAGQNMIYAQNIDNQLNPTKLQQPNQKVQATDQQQPTTTTPAVPQNYEQIKAQSQLQREGKDSDKPQSTVSKIYHTYLFYGICLFCVSYYIYSLQTTPIHRRSNPEQRQHQNQKNKVHHSKEEGEVQKDEQKDENLPSVEENEEVQHVSDQEL